MEKELKILIVENSDSERAMVIKALTEHSDLTLDNIVESDCGVTALQLLNRTDIALVISSWQMKNMNGLELLLNMRSEAKLANIPFIMVSTFSNQIRVKDAIEAGADDYITRPYKPEVLTKHVKDTLLSSLKRSRQQPLNGDSAATP